MFDDETLREIRDQFHYADTCPYQGERVFFENAGGSLTLKSVVNRTTELLAIPDNQGRANVASVEIAKIIESGKSDMKELFKASSGTVFIGETGTELLGRLIRSAILVTKGRNIVGSTLEHPATYSACERWAEVVDKEYRRVPFNAETSVVTAEHYSNYLDLNTGVATIIHASPVTGMHVDVASIAQKIREVAPETYIIVDGIQFAAHGEIDIDSYDIDAYVVSGYKMFSRHNYGVAWLSERMAKIKHDQIKGAPEDAWELGTRDVSAYGACSEVFKYLVWLGKKSGASQSSDVRSILEQTTKVIKEHERGLVDLMLHGTDSLRGLAHIEQVKVIGPISSEHRSGMVSFQISGMAAAAVVEALNKKRIRTHARKRDHYSSTILEPLGVTDCVRASLCHYNSVKEIELFLEAVRDISS